MLHTEVDERTIQGAANGDPRSLERLYTLLWTAFKRQASSSISDGHDALSAFHDAFLKFADHLPRLEWRGAPQLCAYFKRVLSCTCIDHIRRERVRLQWEQRHLLPTIVESPDGEEEERVELVPGPKDLTDHLGRDEDALAAWADLLADLVSALSEGGSRILDAYRRMADEPGSESWGDHRRTGFVKAEVGLADGAFYPAHSRFGKAVFEVITSRPEAVAATGLVPAGRSVRVVKR